jgi:hypothetical protein
MAAQWLYTDSLTDKPERYTGEGTMVIRTSGGPITGPFALWAELGYRAWTPLVIAGGSS